MFGTDWDETPEQAQQRLDRQSQARQMSDLKRKASRQAAELQRAHDAQMAMLKEIQERVKALCDEGPSESEQIADWLAEQHVYGYSLKEKAESIRSGEWRSQKQGLEKEPKQP